MTAPDSPTTPTADDSAPPAVDVYHQLGGAPAMSAFVKALHRALVDDAITAPHFVHMDTKAWTAHRAALRGFLAAALGGPRAFRGPSMVDAHRDVHVTTAAFDRLVHHAVTILRDMGVREVLIGHVGEAIAPLRPHIVQGTP